MFTVECLLSFLYKTGCDDVDNELIYVGIMWTWHIAHRMSWEACSIADSG
jgi:hypothetical protein